MHVTRLFMQGGVVMFVLVLITLVLLATVIRALWHLFVRGGNDRVAIQSCLDGLLFWGGFSVVVGVLGSVVGYHKAFGVVVARGVVNPPAVWIGSAEGMVSSIAGLLLLAVAGVLWFVFRWQFLRTTSSWQ